MSDQGTGQGAPGAGGLANVLSTTPEGLPPANGGGTQGGDWYSGFAKGEQADYIKNKGWDGPAKVVDSYINLEKLIGKRTDAFSVPAEDDAEGWKNVYSKLGRPESPELYTLPKQQEGSPEVQYDDNLVNWFKSAAHEAGITGKGFQKMLSGYGEVLAKQEEAAFDRHEADVNATKTKLRQELGDKFNESMAAGNRATRALGLKDGDVVKIQQALGAEQTARIMMQIGTMVAEDRAEGLGGNNAGGGFTSSTSHAKEKIKEIREGRDPKFLEALQNPHHIGHKDADAQWRKWLELANSK